MAVKTLPYQRDKQAASAGWSPGVGADFQHLSVTSIRSS